MVVIVHLSSLFTFFRSVVPKNLFCGILALCKEVCYSVWLMQAFVSVLKLDDMVKCVIMPLFIEVIDKPQLKPLDSHYTFDLSGYTSVFAPPLWASTCWWGVNRREFWRKDAWRRPLASDDPFTLWSMKNICCIYGTNCWVSHSSLLI